MLHRAKSLTPGAGSSARRVHWMRVMKHSLLALAVLSLVSVACAAGPSSFDGSSGGPAAGTGGSSSAGAPSAAGTGGSLTVGHGGAPAAAGSSGSSGAAGMAGSSGTGPTTCSAADAFLRVSQPAGPLTIGAWSAASSSTCWTEQAASCSFTVYSWGPSPTNPARYRMGLMNVKCDQQIYFGSGSSDACVTKGACDAFDGSNASVVAIDFDLTAGASGFVASNMEEFASNPSGSGGHCDITSSPAADMLTTAAEDLLASMTFACGK